MGAPRLTAGHVGELVEELAPLVRGARVRDVEPLPPRDVLLVLQPEGDDAPLLRLRVSADPDAARLHAQQGRVHKHKGPVGPFFQRLRDELVGGRLARLSRVAGDRIVALEFRETPEGRRDLVAELTGRHANLLLVDGAERIVEVLVPAPAKAGESPRLAVGEPWKAPPGRAGGSTAPPLAELLPEPDEPAPGPRALPLSWRVERALGGAAVQRDRDRLAKDLRDRLKRRRKRVASALAGLAKRRAAAAGAERVRCDGELLKANLHRLARGQASVEVEDYFREGAPPRTIELDPRRSPVENVERLFARARKLERGAEELDAEERREEARGRALDALLRAAEEDDADPAELERRALAEGLLDRRQPKDPRRAKPPAPRLPYRVFHTARGAEVRVGRSARDNDALSFRHARGNDLWLHTRDTPGSHVVLRLEKGAEPHEEDVIDAAHLAVHFSPLKGATRAAVHVARCKELRKPKGAPAGLVSLAGGRTRDLRIDPDRLRALLDRRRPAPGGPAESDSAEPAPDRP